MWEFSISMDNARAKMAKYIYNNLKKSVQEIGGVITSYEQSGKIHIVLACSQLEKSRLSYYITDTIAMGICSFVKEDFLEKNLKFPPKDALETFLFKKALVCFDRETDRFIINKYLNLDKNLIVESFFHFKLQALKEKWQELIKIANDNSTYFLSEDSFIELLKFLIDNIEFSCDEITVIYKKNHTEIYDSNKNLLNENLTQFDLISKLLELSPRKIIWSGNEHNNLIEKVFEKRILFAEIESNIKCNDLGKS